MIELDQLVALERRVWDALVAGDAEADAALLADHFVGVYPTGVADRDGHAGQLEAGPSVAEYELSEARMLAVAADAAMLTYRAAYRRPSGPVEQMFVSSLWCGQGGEWLNVFSQDTPCEGA